MIRVFTSSSAAARLTAVRELLAARPAGSELVVAAASRGAADDLVRSIAAASGATFGFTRFSFTELAARAAASREPGARRLPGTHAGAEAMAARAVFDATAADELAYFAPVARMPGFPKALARTLHELRLAGIESSALPGDVGRLLARVEAQLGRAGVDDRAALFEAATAACRAAHVRWARLPLVLIDVPLDSRAEREFAEALAESSPEIVATVPDADEFALAAFTAIGARVEKLPDCATAGSDLAALRAHVFTAAQIARRDRAGDVSLFSAPGEGREAVEIIRRVLDEAAGGVPFDDMAVLLRTPQQYLGLLEHAAARGDVPVYFDRGTRRPDPAGRAFVALLSCAIEGLSAKRFDEYLSLGQVPRISDQKNRAVVRPTDEVYERPPQDDDATDDATAADSTIDSDDEAVIAGTLRSPWKWEELIVESAVVGGRTRSDGKTRWTRRLDGLAADFRFRIAELQRDEPESPRIARYKRDLRNLVHLRRFALPIIEALAAWPDEGSWGDWIERFDRIAQQALRRPDRVRATLADLRPMADISPVTLEEARDVLHDRLVTLDWEPPARRYGRLFVGTPHQARGRTFRVVFVPGLAERIVPQRPREDPLLLDDRRRAIDGGLVTQESRGAAERLLLKIALGAATERVYLSYPRLDVAETRARVPSFYALDVMRAITGWVPDHRVLAADAAEEGGAGLAWPAPGNPDRAIDDLEHDLATLKPLLDAPPGDASVRGRAHYLLALNPALRRSVSSRWLRDKKAWSSSDGLVRVTPAIQRAIDRHRLGHRAYSLSALQRFAGCPYQFLLATIHRLQPWEEPEPLVRLDPLTRGSLYHRAQAEFYRAMQSAGRLPIEPDGIADAARTLDDVLDRVAEEYAEQLAPAIDRVWRDQIGELRRDLGIWVQKLADNRDWIPEYFEFSFGLSDEGRDPRSLADPISVDGRFILHGSVDLIERHRQFDVLRVTDHKTGKNRSNPGLVVGGGAVLQPVLYSVAIEQGLGKRVFQGRLFYSTTAGGFVECPIDITDYTRRQGIQVLEIIDRAVETGFLAAAPAERACTWCDFRPVCGPREEERIARKAKDRLADLEALRSMR